MLLAAGPAREDDGLVLVDAPAAGTLRLRRPRTRGPAGTAALALGVHVAAVTVLSVVHGVREENAPEESFILSLSFPPLPRSGGEGGVGGGLPPSAPAAAADTD